MITHDHELAARLPRQIEMLDGRIVTDSRPATGATPAGVNVDRVPHRPAGEDS